MGLGIRHTKHSLGSGKERNRARAPHATRVTAGRCTPAQRIPIPRQLNSRFIPKQEVATVKENEE